MGDPTSVPVWLADHAERRGVQTDYGFTIREIDADARLVTSAEGAELPYDPLFVVPLHRPAHVLLDSGLAGPNGVKVDPYTLTTECGNV